MPHAETFNLLTLGQRGAGKTVFLAASYAQLHTVRSPALWFDSESDQSQQDIENILGYVGRTGNYVPATIKITNFAFSLKRRVLGRAQVLCRFRWQDLPGEFCRTSHPEFRESLLNTHGCCVFLDAHALLYDTAYLVSLEREIFEQVYLIANLVHLNNLKYPFALVLTKCDLLPSLTAEEQQKLADKLRTLTSTFDRLGSVYHTFYAKVVIEREAGQARLVATSGAEAIPWLVWLVCRNHQSGPVGSLFKWISLVLGAQRQSKAAVLGTIFGTAESTTEKPKQNSRH